MAMPYYQTATTTIDKNGLKLSVVIPCYNEVDTIEKVLDRVLSVGLADEVVIVDDGSSDGTRDVLHQMQDEGREGVRIAMREMSETRVVID